MTNGACDQQIWIVHSTILQIRLETHRRIFAWLMIVATARWDWSMYKSGNTVNKKFVPVAVYFRVVTEQRPIVLLFKQALNDETEILTKTETFTLRPNFPKLTQRLFSRPKFLKPKPKPCRNWQKSRDRDWNRDFWISLKFFGEIHILGNCCLPTT